MKTLRKGNAGQEVSHLQKILQSKGYPLTTDGSFGHQTHLAVCVFQKKANLVADGIVGQNTWNALLDIKNVTSVPDVEKPTNATIKQPATVERKQEIDFTKAAELLGVEEAAVRAVHQVESGGRNGFLPDGRPMILFEGHIFWNQLKKQGLNPENYVNGNEDILFPKWNRTAYKGGATEHERLKRACEIDRNSALCSASWGMFQIMGFNYRLCGYNSVYEYVSAMESNQNNQFMAFVNFLKNTKLDIPLKNLAWATFAEKYNGPGYKQNHYDEKLEYAYRQYKNKGQ